MVFYRIYQREQPSIWSAGSTAVELAAARARGAHALEALKAAMHRGRFSLAQVALQHMQLEAEKLLTPCWW